MEAYKTIQGRAVFEIEEKKSRFIGSIAHVESEEEARAFLEEIRVANRDARHNVFAWRLRDGMERQSDDGEPSKTSGMPTLEVLRHEELVDVIVVTTRYFGGTLLGTGGLVRAYTSAAQGAVAAATPVLMSSCIDITLTIPYNMYDQVVYALNQHPHALLDTAYTDKVTVSFRMVEGTETDLVEALAELLHGDKCISIEPPHHAPFHDTRG